MRGNAAMAVSVLALTNIGLGWYAGFRSFTGYVLFWLLCAFVVLASMRLMRRAFPADGLADAILRDIGYGREDGIVVRMKRLAGGAGAASAATHQANFQRLAHRHTLQNGGESESACFEKEVATRRLG